jgi:hypothetical protein
VFYFPGGAPPPPPPGGGGGGGGGGGPGIPQVSHPLTPTPLPLTTGGEGLLEQTLNVGHGFGRSGGALAVKPNAFRNNVRMFIMRGSSIKGSYS